MPTAARPHAGLQSDTTDSAHLLQKKKRAAEAALPLENLGLYLLQNLDVLCLPALRTLHHVELHLLAFLQAAESVGLDCRKMHENIFAVLTADEAVALCIVEPLNCSLFHVGACKPRCFFRLCAGSVLLDWCRQGHSVVQGRHELATTTKI